MMRWALAIISLIIVIATSVNFYFVCKNAQEVQYCVLIKFESPDGCIPFVNGRLVNKSICLSTKYNYKISLRRDGLIEREFDYIPKNCDLIK